MSTNEEIYILDFTDALSKTKAGIVTKNVISYWCRNSLSMKIIKGDSIKNHLIPLLEKAQGEQGVIKVERNNENQLLSPKVFNIRSNSSKFEKRAIKHTYSSETNQSEKNK